MYFLHETDVKYLVEAYIIPKDEDEGYWRFLQSHSDYEKALGIAKKQSKNLKVKTRLVRVIMDTQTMEEFNV